jgi:hypothetical protein
MPGATLKRSRSALPEAEPQPLHAGDLPTAVWEDRLLPLLRCGDAVRLGSTCKALRGLVRDHSKALGSIRLSKLQAALTAFPRARALSFMDVDDTLGDGVKEALLQWLREEGQGRHLEWVHVDNVKLPASTFVHEALRGGALPSLRSIDVNLDCPTQRASLIDGLVAAMHELRVTVSCTGADHLAALGMVRQLPALTTLDLHVHREDQGQVQWPPFIPPSLRSLDIGVKDNQPIQGLLRALPGMLEASGARLKRLHLHVPTEFADMVDGLMHVAQALRCCSPTLKNFCLSTGFGTLGIAEIIDDLEAQSERLRLQWADVLAGMMSCRELEFLALPDVLEPLFPHGTVFARLTHLQLTDHQREHHPGAGEITLWELMASGGLPALSSLAVKLDGRWRGVDEVRARMVPAFEAVSATLTHLDLDKDDLDPGWLSDEVDMGYALGMAVGKLQRLESLALTLSDDGRVYHAMAEGLASGGGRPLPVLRRLRVSSRIGYNADLVGSLLLPGVRVFGSDCLHTSRAALLTACAVRRAGYKHTLVLSMFERELKATVLAITRCPVSDTSL